MDKFYYSNNCVTQYWVHNEERNCIAYGKIESRYDKLAKELKAKKTVHGKKVAKAIQNAVGM